MKVGDNNFKINIIEETELYIIEQTENGSTLVTIKN